MYNWVFIMLSTRLSRVPLPGFQIRKNNLTSFFQGRRQFDEKNIQGNMETLKVKKSKFNFMEAQNVMNYVKWRKYSV